ncbi:MAG: hypothetical protein ACC742_16630 [Thermoanaerobaculales bacterium]
MSFSGPVVRLASSALLMVSTSGPSIAQEQIAFGTTVEVKRIVTEVRVVHFDGSPVLGLGPEDFNFEEARNVASMADALELIGDALKTIPGTKSLVFFGYALGRMSAGPRVTIDDGYRRAMEALSAARTSVFSLDITDADYHSLALGLRTIAEDTGGFYVKTHLFPDTAMTKLVRVISSYYELEIIPPPDTGETFTIKVKVDRAGAEVYVRQYHPSPQR